MTAVFDSWNGDRARTYRRHSRHPRRPGDRRRRRRDGLRQHPSTVRQRCLLHPRPRYRCTGPLRRLPGQRPRRRRRKRQPGRLRAGSAASGPAPRLRRAAAPRGPLEQRFLDMCDIEFTIEDGQLWVLQVRVGKRSPSAAFRIAVDLVDEGRIDLDEALRRVDGAQLQSLLHPQFAATDGAEVVGRGLAASPGAAVGEVVLRRRDGDRVGEHRSRSGPGPARDQRRRRGRNDRRCRSGHRPRRADLSRGVVARGLGRTCVTGVVGLDVDVDKRSGTWPDGTAIREGDLVSVDGTTGTLYRGPLTVRPSDLAAALRGEPDEAAPSWPAVPPSTASCGTPTGGAASASGRTPKPAPMRGSRGSTRRRHRALPDRAHAPRLPTPPGREPRHRRRPRRRSRRDRLGHPDRAHVGPASHGRRPGRGPTSRPAAARVPARPGRTDRVGRRRGCSRPAGRRCPLSSAACAAVA